MTARPAIMSCRLAWLVMSVVTVSALSLALAAAAGMPQEGSIVLSVELPDQPTAGARLFVEKSCVRCHALGGQRPGVGPDLGRIPLSGSVIDTAGAFWNHGPVMREKMQDLKIQPPMMTSHEMADIVAFLTAYRYYLTELGQPGDAAAGSKVFVAKGCARCHENASMSFSKPGPSLQHYRGTFSSIILAQVMWNHGPEMASVMRARGVPWPRFSGREMGDLMAFLQGNGGGTNDRVYIEPGSPRRGRDLFTSKQCVACHAIGGIGGRGGPDLARPTELKRPVSEIAGLMWNHSQAMSVEFQRRRIPRVTFSGQEMADILAYLYFVNYATVRAAPARGRVVFDAKCSMCHTMGAGRRVGPDLATAPGLDEPFSIVVAMWSHAQTMEQELRSRGLTWPRFERGEAAELIAFIISARKGPRGTPAH